VTPRLGASHARNRPAIPPHAPGTAPRPVRGTLHLLSTCSEVEGALPIRCFSRRKAVTKTRSVPGFSHPPGKGASRPLSAFSQVNAFERGQATQANQVAGFTNALIGITPTTDPLGNERDVWTGPKKGYWTNGLGQTVNSDTSPGPGWQPLTPKQ
jgi:hypothetical protein